MPKMWKHSPLSKEGGKKWCKLCDRLTNPWGLSWEILISWIPARSSDGNGVWKRRGTGIKWGNVWWIRVENNCQNHRSVAKYRTSEYWFIKMTVLSHFRMSRCILNVISYQMLIRMLTCGSVLHGFGNTTLEESSKRQYKMVHANKTARGPFTTTVLVGVAERVLAIQPAPANGCSWAALQMCDGQDGRWNRTPQFCVNAGVLGR